MKNNCPICDNKTYSIKGKAKTNSISANFIKKDYKVVQCTNCSTYFVLPGIEFSDEQWSELYNSEYFPDQSQWLIKQRSKELKQRFSKAESYLQNKNYIKFLDIGAGEGKTLIEGSNRGWDVTGIDIVDNRIENAKSGKINFIVAKFLEYPFPDNYFDFIYLDSVLEHVLEPVEYLDKIKRIIKNKGIIYIGVPNEDSLFNDVRRFIFKIIGRQEISEKIKPFCSPYHVVGFNFISLNFLIKKLNLTVRNFRNFGRKFEFLSNTPDKKEFWMNLFFLFPIEIIGYIIKRDVYFEAYLYKDTKE